VRLAYRRRPKIGHINFMSAVAQRIRARLKVLGLTPRAASLRANRQPFAVRDILSGKNENPKADLILDLARALVCSTDYLLGLREDPGAAPQSADIDPRLLGVLQRIPPSAQGTVRRMLEGVAEKSLAEFEADKGAKRKKRAKPRSRKAT
jgi:hypothetical protein